jgi:protein TonB
MVMRFSPAGASIATSRVDIEFPSGLSSEMSAAMAALDAVVDATGAVTSVRLARVGARREKHGVTSSDLRTLEDAMAKAMSRPDHDGAAAHPVFTDAAAAIRDLEALTKAAAAALQQWRFVPPQAAPAIARVSVAFDLTHGRATFGPVEPLSGFPAPPTSTFATAPPPASRAPADVLRVGGNIRPPQKIVNVPPVYPQEAQDARVQGVVIIEAKIDADGSVAEAWVLRSIPLLDQAALDAVKQWRYAPTLLNGAPIPVIMTVTVNFTLSD